MTKDRSAGFPADSIRALFGEFLEGAPEVVVLSTDRQGRVTYLNHAAGEVLGIERPARPGAPGPSISTLAIATDAERLEALLAGAPGRHGLTLVRLVDLSGRPLTVRATIEVGAEGLVLVGIQTTEEEIHLIDDVLRLNNQLATAAREMAREKRELAMEVTARKKAEAALRESHERLEERVAERTASLVEANGELEAYSYAVAHELRSPLRAIDGYSALIAESCDDLLDDEGLRAFERLRWNAQRMGHLIDDFLDFSNTGRVDLSFGPVDMTRLAREAFASVASDPALRSRVAFSMDAVPEFWGDAALLKRLWESLLSNAVKFSAGREEPEIHVEGRIEAGELVCRVRDNGVGFDMKYVDKLFGVFHRLHAAHEFEGTGVGLALARRIVVRHGGRIRAEGEVDGGATFSFSLPVRERSPQGSS